MRHSVLTFSLCPGDPETYLRNHSLLSLNQYVLCESDFDSISENERAESSDDFR